MNTLVKVLVGSVVVGGGFVSGFGLAAGVLPEFVEVEVTKEVKVPGPEKIVKVEVPGPVEEVEVVKEVEVEVPVTPKACREAIQSAERLGGLTVEFTMFAAEWPMLVPKAYEAGLMADAVLSQRILDTMDKLNAQAEDLGSKVEVEVDEFNRAKGGC